MTSLRGVAVPISNIEELPGILAAIGQNVVNQHGFEPLDLETLKIDVVTGVGRMNSETNLRLSIEVRSGEPTRDMGNRAP